ncbi:MAG: hypothetical protein JWP01_1457 [Myxococcales bacterium]|nr:hypothetical protein [Myxococcales bacterium]
MALITKHRATLRRYLPVAVIAILAVAIAWMFAGITLRYTRPMGLPLDDSYIYLTYAKQFGRAQPFTYFPGGGYSAGSTSVLWPMLLAPFWTLGARGHALVWVSFLMCTVLYVATCLGVSRVVHRIAGEVGGVVAAVILLGIGAFAWTSLSGMEVAFAAALLVATIWLLLDQPATGRPTRRLIACLAALSLSRPEATLLVIAIVGLAGLQRLRQRDVRSALWWMLPLIAPALWMIANKLLAGQLFPNTGVVKSHFYLPGFDWTYWRTTVVDQTGTMLKTLFWDPASPLVWPRAVLVLWLAGAVRIVLWGRRENRRLVAALLLLAPFALMLAVVGSSGQVRDPWKFQNYRYIAPAFALLVIPVGCAFAAIGTRREVQWGVASAGLVLSLLFARAALPGLVVQAKNFAQGAMDTNTQVVAIGHYVNRKLPDASVMFHDAGAIAYYGDGRVYDMLGLVTNYQAGIANHGPGSRFEFLESLPAEKRPTHFAYYPAWLGTSELFGDVLLHTPIRPGIAPNRHVGDSDMQVIAASWDHVGTAEQPLTDHPGWTMVDRIDIAHLASERAHGWIGALGRRKMGDPTARWSFVGREVGAHGLVLDGGRTIRGGSEQLTITRDPAKPVRLVLRTAGLSGYPFHETITTPVELKVLDASGRVLATQTLPAPQGQLVEVVFELPAGTPATLRTQAASPYRAFHWFVLQPE